MTNSWYLAAVLAISQFVFACAVVLAEDKQVSVENALLKTIESVQVAAEVPGLLVSVPVSEGTLVEPGTEIALIRDDAARLAVEQAKLRMQSAQKRKSNDVNHRLAIKGAAVSENEYKRAENANRQVAKTYPQNELDRLRLVADRAQLEIERARLELDLAEIDASIADSEYRKAVESLSRHKVVSPTSGMIVAVDKRGGEWVEPGTKLAQIVRIDRLRIEGFVSSDDASLGLVGCQATVTIRARTKENQVKGKVVFVSPDAIPVNSLVRVFVEIENRSGENRPGLKVNAVIHKPMP